MAERLPRPPAREAVPADERDDYDRVVERTSRVHDHGGNPARYFEALLNAPPLAAAMARLGTLVREGQLRGTYSDAERELIDLVYAHELGYNGHLLVHVPDALAVGVRVDAIDAIRAGREERLTRDERELADYAREVANGTASDDSYAAMRRRFGDRGALELTVFCAFLLMTLRLWQALGVPDVGDREIDELLAGLRDGTTPVPGGSARIG